MKCYWWSHPCKAGVYNFGDLLTPMLMKYYGASHCIRAVSSPADADLLVVGSILQGVPEQNSPIILGAGSLTDKTLNIPKAKVYALRGLLTKERLGITDDVVVGDPGLLISRILPVTQLALDAKAEDMKPIGIVPHWKHYASSRLERYRSDPRFKFINPRCKPEQVAKEICSCSSIIASSLHALIVADAYGVPNVRLNFNDGLRDVCDFKYEDYYSAIARTGFAARSITPEEISTDLAFDTDYKKNIARVQDNLDNVFRRFYTEQCALRSFADTKISSMSAPKVSVIVPVYRAKDYLPELLDSLLNQTLREMEFIFVDDRGGDGTFDIVREAAKNDSRIVCLENEKNSGPGYSRNRGMEVARGEYIAFADADDFVDLSFYETLYAHALQLRSLVVKGSCHHVYADGTMRESRLNVSIKDKKTSRLTLLNAFTTEHWSAIYSRKFLLDVGARYEESSHYGEDTYFLMTIMYHLKYDDFSIADRAIYFYRQQEDSLMHCNKDRAYFEQIELRGNARLDWIYSHPDTADIAEYTANFFEGQLGWILDGALNGDASEENVRAYLAYCLFRLDEWKSSDRVYKPGVLASALVELRHRPDLFCSLRKVYQRLEATKHQLGGLHREFQRELNNQLSFRRDVQSWQKGIEERLCRPLDIVESVVEKIGRMRAEVVLQGGVCECLELDGADDLQVSSPVWLCQNGYGVLAQGKIGAYTLRVHVKQEGRLTLRFRGCYVRVENGRVPAWVDVASLRVDGVDYGAHTVWYDKSYTVHVDAQTGQTVTVELITQPHLHTDEEVVRLLEAFYPKKAWSDDERKIMVGQLQSRFAALRGVSLPELHSRTVDQQIQLRNLSDDCQALQVQHNSLQSAHGQLESKTVAIEKSLSAKLCDARAVIVEQKRTITSQQRRLESLETSLRESERSLTHTRKELAAAVRIQQLSVLMPRLWWRYQILRLKKTFSFGKRRERYKQKIKAIKAIIREYRDAVRQMRRDIVG